MVKVINLKWEKRLLTNRSARAVALDTLIRVLEKDSYSNISLNNELQKAHLSANDSNFATRIVYGTIQYKIYLEYQLHDLIKTKLKEIYLRPLLLMSAYQIIFMDKVPNRAVLNEANKLAKQFGKVNSNGFRIVNGVLRALIRRQPILPTLDNLPFYLSVKESVPEWLVEYLLKHLGAERTASILSSINEPAKNIVRVSQATNLANVISEMNQLGFNPQESTLNLNELIVSHGGISKTSLFKNGEITIQDEAASLAVQAFDFVGNEQVLDACSAPGGKTVQIAENIPQGNVIALDIHEKKLHLVEQNCQRMKVSKRVTTKALDARHADQAFAAGKFDKVLVDAPCSGLGLIRRKPEIRYNKKLTDLTDLQKIQLQILDHVCSLLRSGGELVYSTCTITQEEDEDVVKIFLKKHPEFELKPFKAAKMQAPNGMLKILPDSYGSDGFFISKFVVRG